MTINYKHKMYANQVDKLQNKVIDLRFCSFIGIQSEIWCILHQIIAITARANEINLQYVIEMVYVLTFKYVNDSDVL